MKSSQFLECSHEAFYDNSIQRLRDHQFKITDRRKAILKVFDAHDGYLTARAVHEALTVKYPTMSYDTTYRNIYDFVKLGILESNEFNQEQLFRTNCIHDHHHHHFICTKCGRALPIEGCPIDSIVETLGNVKIESHRFDVFGLCSSCNEDSK